MKHIYFALIALLSCSPSSWANDEQPLDTIVFGSCAHQDHPQPFWGPILDLNPDLFIFAGDNIYADTYDPAVLRAQYAKLGSIDGFQKIRKACPVLATWDDHDYGINDSGGELRSKVESEREFLNFFEVPEDSPRRKRPGIYDAVTFGPPGKRVQVILLDMRYFRSPWKRKAKRAKRTGAYEPTDDTNTTLLGEAQWKWLEEQFRQPAELRLLVSSIQLVSDQHAWESWSLMPHERRRLFKLIEETHAEGLICISGDRHHGELSLLQEGVGYPLYDLTSSGLTQGGGRLPETNPHLVGDMLWDKNFGVVAVDWDAMPPAITLRLHKTDGTVALEEHFPLSKLRFNH